MDILSNFCAACLNTDNNLKTAISEKFKICLPQYVSEYFDIGQCRLCERCVSQLNDCYKFVKTSLKSKGRLEEMIIRRIRVKEEVVEVKDEGDVEEPILVDCKVLIEEGNWNADEDPLQTDASETTDVDKKFSCRVCRKKFRFYSTLKRHQRTSGHKTYKLISSTSKHAMNDSEKTHPCHVCTENFPTQHQLIHHSTTHINFRPFICECGQKFTRKCGLNIHQRSTKHATHTVDKTFNGTFICCVCGKKFDFNSELLRHNKMHKKYQPQVCECGRKFLKKTNLTLHRKICRKSGGKVAGSYFCRICDEKFVSKTELYRHKQIHVRYRPYVRTESKGTSIDGKYSCLICGEAFVNVNMLRRHNRTHIKFRMIACECGKEFVSKVLLMKHQKVYKHVRFRVKSEAEVKKFETLPAIDESKKLRCEQCDKVFVTVALLRRHMVTHSDEKPFSCTLCPKKFSRLTGVAYHMKSIHEKIPNYTCDICGKGFYVKYKLNVHVKSHSNQKCFKCSICFDNFADASACERHVKLHNDSTVNKYKCPQCPSYLISEDSLKNHIFLKHTEAKTFSCNFCQKLFSCKSRCNDHIKLTHHQVRNHVCDLCGKAFSSKPILRVHVNSHNGIKAFECHICNRTFAHHSTLKNHIERHSNQKNFLCSQCGGSFYSDRTLRFHIASAHTLDKPHPCPHCDKKFVAKYQLRNHINQHHLDFKPFVCDICNKGFVEARALKRHKTMHSDDRPFSCPTCSATFKSQSHVTRHLRNNVCAELGKDTKIRKRKTTKHIVFQTENSGSN